jgi:hypothetical protein
MTRGVEEARPSNKHSVEYERGYHFVCCQTPFFLCGVDDFPDGDCLLMTMMNTLGLLWNDHVEGATVEMSISQLDRHNIRVETVLTQEDA